MIWVLGINVSEVISLVLGESHSFPELARIWHDDVAAKMLPLVAEVIRRAQARQEVRPGAPELYASSAVGAILMAALFKKAFGAFSPTTPDIQALAALHSSAVLRGILTDKNGDPDRPLRV